MSRVSFGPPSIEVPVPGPSHPHAWAVHISNPTPPLTEEQMQTAETAWRLGSYEGLRRLLLAWEREGFRFAFADAISDSEDRHFARWVRAVSGTGSQPPAERDPP